MNFLKSIEFIIQTHKKKYNPLDEIKLTLQVMMIKQKQSQASLLGLGKQSVVGKKTTQQTQQLIIKQAQTRKKLSKISSLDELQKIYNVIKKQNTQLVKDFGILKQHLVMVEDNKRMQKQQKAKSSGISNALLLSSSRLATNLILTQQQRARHAPQIIGQWQGLRKQLYEQYKLMGYLKSNIASIKSSFPTEQIAEQHLSRKSTISQLAKTIQTQRSQKLLLQKQHKHLSQSVASEINSTNPHEEQILLLEVENKQLRKRLLQQKQQVYQHQSKAAKVIDGLYQKKQLLTLYEGSKSRRQQQVEEVIQSGMVKSNKRSNSVRSVHDTNKSATSRSKKPSPLTTITSSHAQTTPQTPNHLSTQITTLKNQVNQLSLASIKAKQVLKKQKQTLKQNNNKLNQNFISLQKNKTKKINQLNHLKAKLNHILNQIQHQQLQKVKMVNSEVQAEGFGVVEKGSQQLLRRDFAGVIGHKNRFDDRMFLKSNTKAFIKGLIVYQNDSNLSIKGSLAAIRAIYTDQTANQMNFIPLPGSYIQKCKTIKFQLPQDDFVKLMKVKFNTKQTRITKIQIRSNRNLRYEFGDKKPFQEINQFETVYAFDIGLNEFPVAMFGSFCLVRNCWYLESIGVEINTLV